MRKLIVKLYQESNFWLGGKPLTNENGTEKNYFMIVDSHNNVVRLVTDKWTFDSEHIITTDASANTFAITCIKDANAITIEDENGEEHEIVYEKRTFEYIAVFVKECKLNVESKPADKKSK